MSHTSTRLSCCQQANALIENAFRDECSIGPDKRAYVDRWIAFREAGFPGEISIAKRPAVDGRPAYALRLRSSREMILPSINRRGSCAPIRPLRVPDPLCAPCVPTLPSVAVIVSHRSEGSGTTSIFTTYLPVVSPDWKQKIGTGPSVSWPTGIGGKGSEGVTGNIRNFLRRDRLRRTNLCGAEPSPHRRY
jgi:hypothetical protein